MRFIDHPSPNFNDRKNGLTPEFIIFHYTGKKDTAEALAHLSDPKTEVSCHFLIDEEGNIYQMVDPDKRAWHAGVSSWKGKDDINSRSVGIELSNRNNEPYTNQQLFALALLTKALMHKYSIPPENILGHSDIAPDRKQDPGAHFPWETLARHGIGRWPKPSLKDQFNAAAVAKNQKRLRKLFARAGYPTEKVTMEQLVTAFQRRFEQKTVDGIPKESTVAKLRALIRQRYK